MPIMQTQVKTATNAAGVKALAADYTIESVGAEFSPGTGGLNSPYLHVALAELTPKHTIVVGGTTETAIALTDFFASGRPVRIQFSSLESRGDHWVANLMAVFLN